MEKKRILKILHDICAKLAWEYSGKNDYIGHRNQPFWDYAKELEEELKNK